MDKEIDAFLLDEIVKPTSSSLESSSSSSSEEENETKAIRVERSRIKNYLDVVKTYSDKEFKEHFRMNQSTVDILIRSYSSQMKSYRGGWTPLTAEKAVLMMIWYLANTESFRQLADRFDVTLSCAHNALKSVGEHLVNISENYIKWPSEDDARQESLAFERRKGLRDVIGAIDGSHIRIRRPLKHEEDYVNRKGYHSILLQATANSKLMFIDVMAGEPGSLHDARMLRKSSLYKTATENYNQLFYNKYCLVGDSAYPSLNWLVTPFKDNGHLTEDQRRFNYMHSSTRIVIENAFGLLKGRFRRLRSFENLDIHFINTLVISACVLHNICSTANDTTDECFIDDMNMIEDEEIFG